MKIVATIAILSVALALASCGNNRIERTVTGSAIGAAGGLAVGAATGAPLLGAAAIGAVGGAAVGAVVDPNLFH